MILFSAAFAFLASVAISAPQASYSAPVKCRARPPPSNPLEAYSSPSQMPGGGYLPVAIAAPSITSSSTSSSTPAPAATKAPVPSQPQQQYKAPAPAPAPAKPAPVQQQQQPKPAPAPAPKPTAPTPPKLAAYASSSTGNSDIDCFLNMHNQGRAEVGLKPLSWSPSLAASAQSYSNTLYSRSPRSISLVHSHKSGVGENLYASSGKATCKAGMQAWLDEKKYYRPGSAVGSGNFEAYGHYTQV